MLIFWSPDGLITAEQIVRWAVFSFKIRTANFICEQPLIARFAFCPKILAQILDDRIGFVFAKIHRFSKT